MQERRSVDREPVQKMLVVRDAKTDVKIGEVADLTEKGVLLVSRLPAPPNVIRDCKMLVLMRTDGKDHINFRAQSKWSVLNEESGEYQTGYEFVEMSDDDRELLRAMLQHWRAPKPGNVKPLKPI